MGDVVAELSSVAESVPRARAMVREAGADLPRHVVEDAELLVSEIVSNAVQHGGPDVRLTLLVDDSTLTVQVYDGGSGLPVVRNTGPEVPSGRGLRMVQSVSSAWGIEVEDGRPGKTVWFRVSASSTLDSVG
jgi:two-component sensor histidine kinase